jgi:transposase
MDAPFHNPPPETPACPGCAQRDRHIAELEARIAEQEARMARLEALARGSKRQAAPFSKGLPKPNPKQPGRKSGQDYGEHHRRAVPQRIDEVLEAPLPERCPRCGEAVHPAGVAQQYQAEIPRQVIHRQFNVAFGHCCGCRRRVQGRHPLQTSDALGAAASQIGPDAQALAVLLNKDAGLSHGKIKRFFEAAFDLKLCRSSPCRVMLRTAKRCGGVYHAIVRRVQQSDTIVPDETGWRIGGLLAWLHVAVGPDATAYLVHRERGYAAAVKLIGEDYAGILIHDGWAPYLRFAKAIHQTCLAHLLRRARELEQAASGAALRFPRKIKAILKHSLAVRDQRDATQPGSPKSATLTPEQAAEEGWTLSRQIETLTSRPRDDAEQERFAKHLWKHQTCLFTFLAFAGVDATNHRAEQALRPAVVNRKVWGGNRTDAGATAQSILMSVLRTAGQRGVDALAFLSGTLKARSGQRPDLLLDTG